MKKWIRTLTGIVMSAFLTFGLGGKALAGDEEEALPEPPSSEIVESAPAPEPPKVAESAPAAEAPKPAENAPAAVVDRSRDLSRWFAWLSAILLLLEIFL